MNNLQVMVIESFNLSTGDIIVELKIVCNGLPTGTRLISIRSGYSWIVNSRQIFSILGNQVRFEGEKENVVFITPVNIDQSINAILSRENEGIFQYSLTGENYNNNPEKGEELRVILN